MPIATNADGQTVADIMSDSVFEDVIITREDFGYSARHFPDIDQGKKISITVDGETKEFTVPTGKILKNLKIDMAGVINDR